MWKKVQGKYKEISWINVEANKRPFIMCSNEELLRANISPPPQRDTSTQQITDQFSLLTQTQPIFVVKK